MDIENTYLQNCKKILLFSPLISNIVVSVLSFIVRGACVWPNSTLSQDIGKRHVFKKDFCKFHLAFLPIH